MGKNTEYRVEHGDIDLYADILLNVSRARYNLVIILTERFKSVWQSLGLIGLLTGGHWRVSGFLRAEEVTVEPCKDTASLIRFQFV